MKKKIFSAALLFAFTVAATSTFVSCKDYDDDINDLRTQITTNATDLKGLVDEKISNINKEIDALKSQDGTLQEALKTAEENLSKAIEAAKTDAEGYAKVQAEAAQKAAIEASQKSIDKAIGELEEAVKKANDKLNEKYSTEIGKLITADGVLTKGIADANTRINAVEETANAAKATAATNKENLDKLTTSLGEISKGLEGQKKLLDEKVEAVYNEIAKNKAELETKIGTVESNIKTNNEAISALQGADSKMLKQIEANTKQLEAMKKVLDGLDAKLQANLDAAKAYTDGELATLKESLGGDINGVKKDVAQAQADATKANEELGKVRDLLESLKLDNLDGIKNLNTNLKTLSEKVDESVAAINEAMGKVEARVSTLEGEVKQNTTDIKEIQAIAAKNSKDIESIIEGIMNINQKITETVNFFNGEVQRLIGMTQRLTSLVFAPTTYVDGIECIKFASLNYTDWGSKAENWLADGPSTKDVYSIDDKKQVVEYLANPTNVAKGDIEGFEFISQEATNEKTRAAATAVLKVKDWDLADGKLKLDLTKEGNGTFGNSGSKFTIVALKATLADKWMTEAEKKNSQKAVVYSDWARLYETTGTPYIHNKLAVDKNGKLEEKKADAHFWKYSEAYEGKGINGEQPQTANDKFVAKEVEYDKTIDLKDLVEVCDYHNTVLGEDRYGFEFEFHVMKYVIKNLGSTEDATDQAHFAKLTGSVLAATSRDGKTEGSRSAIGRQPMIQVVLKDKNNGKVVDVRYFKIKWIDKIQTQVVETPLADQTDQFGCGNVYSVKVLEEAMNNIYAKEDMSKDEFHRNFTLYSVLFKSADDASNMKNIDYGLGTIKDAYDGFGDGQTHNLVWTVEVGKTLNAVIPTEYEAGKKIITAYAVYYNRTNRNQRIVFPVRLTLNIEKMAYKKGVNKDQTMWKGDARIVNPQLESDSKFGTAAGYATTQIIGNILQGYISNGKTPASVNELVNFGESVKFIFDENTLNSIAAQTETKVSQWTIAGTGVNEGKEIWYGGKVAATLYNNQIVLAESANGAAGSEPTPGALKLVGKSIPVTLVDNYCGLPQTTIDSYNFNILTPLKFSNKIAGITLQDITAGGSTSKSLSGTFDIVEAFTSNPRLVWTNKTGDPKHQTNAALVAWYGVKNLTYATAEAVANISKSGVVDGGAWTKLSELTNADGSAKYTVSVDQTANKVTFSNKSGNAIGKAFKIRIPVRVETKWQKTFEATLEITVEPGTAVGK